jgi:glycosyltransferase involved in cell wall biosynthesis
VKLSIVIPIYNEEKTLETILNKIVAVELKSRLEKEFILVDDASQDSSMVIAEDYKARHPKLDIKLFRLQINSGKGAALQEGFRQATGDFVIIQDADLEYDPNEYNEILQPLLDGHADVVYGSRFTGTKPRRSAGFLHYIANKFLTYLSNSLFNIYITDMETCYKAFRKEIIQQLNLKEKRFGIEPEITAKISKIEDIRLYEVAISYYGRTPKEGKKIKWTDGVKAIFYIFKYRFFD